jgi:hypothetical protein
MRVASLPKRLLGLDAVRLTDVRVEKHGGLEVLRISLARRANRRMFCSRCGCR